MAGRSPNTPARPTLQESLQLPLNGLTATTMATKRRGTRKASTLVDEVVEARMLLGLHFRTGEEDGAVIGRQIARQIRSRWFKPRRGITQP